MAFDELLMICAPSAAVLRDRLGRRLTQHWPGDDQPSFREQDLHQFIANPPELSGRVVWLFSGAEFTDEIYDALEVASVKHAPVMLTREVEPLAAGAVYQSGAVVVPPGLDADGIRLIAQALRSQNETIDFLRHELSIVKRHHGGMRSQMNKLDEELRLAARVQQEFLPDSLPALGGVSLNVMFRPASYVSGDIYDAQRLDERTLGFYIADVVGHGVPAALLTMFVRRALPMKETGEHGYRLVPPNEALARLNHEMVRRSTTGQTRFATAVYMTLNVETLVLRTALAGHPHPMILRAGGRVEHIAPEGPLLGVFEDEPFEMQTTQLEPGDRLLLFSDGFETAFGENDKHDTTRYLTEFQKLRQGTPTQAIGMLEKLIDAQPGSLHQLDDLTVLMAAVDAEATVQTRETVEEHAAA